MDEEERQEEKRDKGVINKIKRDVEKGAKSKFKMWLKKLLIALLTSKVGIIFIIILAIITILAAVVHKLDISGSTDTVDVATETIITQNTEIKQAPNSADGYYFQISDDVVKQFLQELNRAYYEGHYLDHIAEDGVEKEHYDNDEDVVAGNDGNKDENQSDFVYDPEDADITEKDLQEWFNAKDYEDYLIKFIRAEIASMYPKLGNYAGGNTGGKDNPKDAEGKYAAQGVVQIQRTLMNQDRND